MDITSIPTIYYQFGVTGIGVILFLTGKKVIKRTVNNRAHKNKFDPRRITYTIKFFNIILSVIILTLVSMIWGITFEGISIYFASIFTVIGVDCFVQWSILSNITAGAILFFNYTYKMGNKMKVIDGDNSVSGKIIDIHPFQFRIQIESGQIVSYPNNLIIQRPTIQLKENVNKSEIDGKEEKK